MRRMFLAVALTAPLLWAVPAAAQTPATGVTGDRLFLGVTAGVAAVQQAGGVLGGEIGFKVTDTIDVFGDVSWMQNVVTRRRLDLAADLAAYLQASQGQTATSTINAPAVYTGAGARITFKAVGRIRPYFAGGAGVARVTLNPAITLAGSDVTSTISQYGVSLGSDLTGAVTKPALTGGLGVLISQGQWYLDGGFRVMNIRTDAQSTNVMRATVTFGMRF